MRIPRYIVCFVGALVFLTGSVRHVASQSREALASEVRRAETAFAGTMASRDYQAFTTFIADEALFFSQRGVLRGKTAVAEAWKAFFQDTRAPFSWEATAVEVLDSGTLALSSGPVRNPAGRETGTFNSIWRREKDGSWKVVFDKGCSACDCSVSR